MVDDTWTKMTSYFAHRLSDLIAKRETVLCVGLDTALPGQRVSQTMPRHYSAGRDENGSRLAFCMDIIDATKDACCAFKPNQQYVAGFTANDHAELTNAIRKAGAISILDYKLNDIGDTMASALFHIRRWGYDALTFNPFLGNIETAVTMAHEVSPEIGVIVLTLTSNPESVRYQKKAVLGDRPLYQCVARDVKRYGADGCVVGATGHIKAQELGTVRQIIGADKVLLVPGIGTQKGDPGKVIRAGGKLLLINVGREIIYDSDPRERAIMYRERFNGLIRGG